MKINVIPVVVRTLGKVIEETGSWKKIHDHPDHRTPKIGLETFKNSKGLRIFYASPTPVKTTT